MLIEDKSGHFPEVIENDDRVVIPKKGYLGLREGITYVRTLSRKLKELNIQVVHSWDYRSEVWEALACRMTGIPYVFTKKNNAWSRRWWLKSFMATHIVYDHPGMFQRFFNRSGFRQKTTFIPHGVNTGIFRPADSTGEIKHVIGCIGNIGHNKNQLVILKALSKSKLPLRCRFYGNTDKKYMETIQEFIRDHQLSDRVEILNFVENHKLPEVIRSLDMVILSSYNEGLPVILLEAMACGTYCLASRSGGGSEFIMERCGSGELFDPDDAVLLANLIENFYADSAKKQRGAREAAVAIEQHFSIHHEGNEYLALFEKL